MNGIDFFKQYVLRTPAFSYSDYLSLIADYSFEKLLETYQNPYLQESLKMASAELLEVLHKWKSNPESFTPAKINTLEISLLKYFARICSRCTPFGLFAGCSMGEFSANTSISLKDFEGWRRVTQFDMQFWIAMLDKFSKNEFVLPHLIFHSNNSVYESGDFYRFIGYKYSNNKREHSILALKKTATLESVFALAKEGISFLKLVGFLADDESENEDAIAFINDLIYIQFLTSELEASVSGPQEWDKVFEILAKIPKLEIERELFHTIQKDLGKLDGAMMPSENLYSDIKHKLLQLNLEFDDKYLFQTDLYVVPETSTLSKNVGEKAKKAIRFLNGIQEQTFPEGLRWFVAAFLKRYESREMPLSTVLDTENGIGYFNCSEMNDSHGILEQFTFNEDFTTPANESWSQTDRILEQKIQECRLQNGTSITLSENDFPGFTSPLDKIPATFSVMLEVIKREGQEKIAITSSGTTSAAKFLGRFCIADEAINKLAVEIVAHENMLSKGKILAEIVHIPESRTGNILRRPVLRDYEIPYLSNSGVAPGNQVTVSDLWVSVKNNKVVLRSHKLGKEIVPCISNAHNYSRNSLPLYYFLCDLQYQDTKPIYNFSWGILESHYDFFPRVLYQDAILSKSRWIISKNELEPFFSCSETLRGRFDIWKTKRNLPKLVNGVDGDNTLLMNLETTVGMKMLVNAFKNKTTIVLEEFLFSEDEIARNHEGQSFTNQFILSFFKTTKI